MHNKEQYTLKHLMSSLLMLFMLVWLTICLPFVNESRCFAKTQVALTTEEAPGVDDSNPLTSTNEEKSEGGTAMPSEYLHNGFVLDHSFFHTISSHEYHPSDLYIAFHPEMIIPPPEAGL